ncbi:MAG: Crp/Fnr family transcriptional regulator [Ruminococcaceae bacterium]|nr:Crp/Fnr family transcriptional regulator [Oscillospiraceae bacterium]
MTEKTILEQFPMLSELPGDKLRQVYAHFKTAPDWLLEHIQVVRFPPDTIFIREGQPARDIYVVASGNVKAIEYRVLGVQYDFIQFTKVYALGGMEVLMDLSRYRTTLKTMEACVAIRLPREAFEQWLATDIEALRYEAKLMGEYLLEQGRLAREYMFLPGPERLAKLLVQKYEVSAVDGLLTLQTSRQALANETGFGIKTVNRAVKSLTDGGYITRRERAILVSREQYESLKRLISMIIAPESGE